MSWRPALTVSAFLDKGTHKQIPSQFLRESLSLTRFSSLCVCSYAYVINDAGVAILHPNINRRVAPPQINDLEFGTSAAAISDADAFSPHLTAMRTLTAGMHIAYLGH